GAVAHRDGQSGPLEHGRPALAHRRDSHRRGGHERRGLEALSRDLRRAFVFRGRTRSGLRRVVPQMNAAATFPPTSSGASTPRVPAFTWASVYLRMLAVQGVWNYETMLGNGIGFAMEPVLRQLPGGVHGERFKQAMARESRYFNAHPYLAAVAIGALARVELDGESPERIERFRTALTGPLGSVGDRLVWAGWLPFCSLVALAAFGLDAGPATTIGLFLVLFNAGHLGLRAWGLAVGWKR